MGEKIMDDILDFEIRISTSMDRILKVLERAETSPLSNNNQSDELSHLEKLIAQLEYEKIEMATELKSTLEKVTSVDENIKNLSGSMDNERLEHINQIDLNQKLNLEIESLKSSRQSQVDEMNSILADLEPLLKNAGETNA
jgi:chromosome segregation ATPase